MYVVIPILFHIIPAINEACIISWKELSLTCFQKFSFILSHLFSLRDHFQIRSCHEIASALEMDDRPQATDSSDLIM